MVAGIEKFREHFAGHEDQYVLIGGAACDLLFEDAGLTFRATKDLDIVFSVEVVNTEFAELFRTFIEKGGYEARQRSDGHQEFYRFHKPTDADYPFMIELFARKPMELDWPDDMGIMKVDVEDDLISLSAILLDDAYFSAMTSAAVTMDGISLLSETLLIPFKAKAHLDLTARKEEGQEVKTRDVKKHSRDVFRLSQLLVAEDRIELPEAVSRDLSEFLEKVAADGDFDPKSFGVDMTKDEGLALIRTVYQLEGTR